MLGEIQSPTPLINMLDNSVDSSVTISIDVRKPNPQSGRKVVKSGSIKLTLHDSTFDIPLYSMIVSPYEVPTDFMTATIDVTKYWPYANSKGQAVWDTTTGAQLCDPTS